MRQMSKKPFRFVTSPKFRTYSLRTYEQLKFAAAFAQSDGLFLPTISDSRHPV